MELPQSIKGVVPVYPGAKVMFAAESGDGSQAVLETADALKAVMDYYRKAMKDKGWSVSAEMAHGTGAMIEFTKGKQALQVTADGPSGKKTTVALNLTKR